MELRKIQVTGGSTHIVSLPKKWVDRNRLGRSDTLAIHEEPDGSLLLVPHGGSRPAHRTLEIRIPDGSGPDDAVRRLVGAYVAGADEIVVRGRLDPGVRRTLRALTRDLVGVELVEETADRMVLQDLVGVSDVDLRKTVTRMQGIARLMFDDAVRALSTRDIELANDVHGRDDELDRLEWMVSKQMHALLEQPRIAARLDVRPAEALNFFLATRSLERIGDHASKICLNVVALGQAQVAPAVLQAILQHADAVRNVWEAAYNALKRSDFGRASAAADDGKGLAAWRAQVPRLLEGHAPEAVSALTLIADSVDRTRGYAVDIAEAAMNQTFHAALSENGRGRAAQAPARNST